MNKKQLIVAWIIAAFVGLAVTSSFAAADQNASKVIEAKAGEEFVITLASNRTTGYGWQLARPIDKKMLALAKSEYLAPQTNLVGAGGKEVWVFKALKPGKITISFKYVRPWEKDVPAVGKETFAIIIK